MASLPSSQSAAPTQKFSRYRSVRQAARQTVENAAPVRSLPGSHTRPTTSPPAQHKDTIVRSMSRYRNKTSATDQSKPPIPPVPPVAAMPSYSHGAGNATTQAYAPAQPYAESEDDEEDAVARELARQEAHDRLVGGDTRKRVEKVMRGQEQGQEVHKLGRSEPRDPNAGQHDRTRTKAATERADDRPARHEESSKRERPSTKKSRQDPKRHSLTDKLNMIPKMKIGEGRAPNVASPDTHQPVTSPHIEPGGRGMVPGVDAPISAVNAGERRVEVRYNKSSIKLPLTPSTRAQDLLSSAANCLPGIEVNKSVLLESFSQLNLERPLRDYEHVREVLNSWNHDDQNSLLVISAAEISVDRSLRLDAAPTDKPSETTFLIHHSQRPGKWDKKFVTLRSDGQMAVAKKPGAEQSNICHLSDFDIYLPTKQQLKKIKAPKKTCLAVKSQQKSSMFETTENFVHFFCSNDKGLASDFYDAVQSWRSWYLVNKLGEVRQGSRPSSARGAKDQSSGYQIGSFKPLVDLETFDYSLGKDPESVPRSTEHGTSKSTAAQKKPTQGRDRRKAEASDSDQPKTKERSGKLVTGITPEEIEAKTFAPTSLLGRTYSMRQNAQREREREAAAQGEETGLLFSHGLLGNAKPHSKPPPSSANFFSQPQSTSRTSTMQSREAPDMKRSPSTRQKPKPLVDLTPVYQEPPQHARKGRGLAAAPGQLLVESATGPEVLPGAIMLPSATTWRRPSQPSSPTSPTFEDKALPHGRPRANTGRNHRHHISPPLPACEVPEGDAAFAPSSLLARSATMSKTAANRGRGVATGDRNAVGKPMLDLTPESQFVEGSLLRSVENWAGDGAGKPVISREKVTEKVVGVGEGV